MPITKVPTPRIAHFMGSHRDAVRIADTWLEAEEFCYASYDGSAMLRRCYARFDDGKLRVVRCAIPDTYFSIPAVARVAGKTIKGYVSSDESGFKFNAYHS